MKKQTLIGWIVGTASIGAVAVSAGQLSPVPEQPVEVRVEASAGSVDGIAPDRLRYTVEVRDSAGVGDGRLRTGEELVGDDRRDRDKKHDDDRRDRDKKHDDDRRDRDKKHDDNRRDRDDKRRDGSRVADQRGDDQWVGTRIDAVTRAS